MFIDEKESKNRVSSLDNLINRLNGASRFESKGESRDEDPYLKIRRIHNGGRPKGRPNDDTDKLEEIAEDAIILGPNVASQIHNTTPSRASLLSNGIVTHGNGPSEELHSKVNSKKDLVHEKALDIIMESLGSLEGKLDKVSKATDLSLIASNMSKVAERTGSKVRENDNSPKVQVVVYAPRVRSITEYEEVEG